MSISSCPRIRCDRVVELSELQASRFDEPMGTKAKEWLVVRTDAGEERWLWKRQQVFSSTGQKLGDFWAEHLASRLFEAMGTPAHVTALARDSEGRLGVLCRHLHPDNVLELRHGAELMQEAVGEKYDVAKNYPRHYEPSRVLGTIRERCGEAGMRAFARQLVLDAWVRNSDRHHENWGILISAAGTAPHVAPAFDNASSLGYRLPAKRRRRDLELGTTRISNFCGKGESAFVNAEGARLRHEQVVEALAAGPLRDVVTTQLQTIEHRWPIVEKELEMLQVVLELDESVLPWLRAFLRTSLGRLQACTHP